MAEKYAIVDIGSNTIRLVIYQHEKSGRFKEMENIKTVARLRNYLDENFILSEQGIKLLLETLIHFEEIIHHHEVSHIKAVGTATIRKAANQAAILERIHHYTSIKIRILSEYEEAYYGYLAVVNSTSLESGITIDIGGGSTEVTYFDGREIQEYHSFPFGALSLKRDFISSDTPTKDELSNLSAFLYDEVRSLPWLLNKQAPIVGIGGSARNMAQVHQGFQSYPIAGLHQYVMDKSDIEEVYKFLSSLSFQELQKLEGLSEDRADIIIPAVQVFKTFYDVTDAPNFLLSRKGLRDGIFFEQLMKPLNITKFPNVIEESTNELITEYEIDMGNVLQATKIASMLFEGVKVSGYASLTEKDLDDLKRAATLFYLGGYIDSEASSQHTFYILANRTIDGFLHKERIQLALLASFKSKSYFKQYSEPFKDWFTKDEIKKLRLMGAILKVAYSLNHTKRNIVDRIEVTADEDGIGFEIFCFRNWRAERYQAEKQKKHLEKSLKEKIEFMFRQSTNFCES